MSSRTITTWLRQCGLPLVRGLSRKEFERLRHEVRVELEHTTVSGIGVDDEVAIRKTPRQIAGVLGWHHAITLAVCDKHRLVNP
jgi:hypothetical protein